MAFTTVLSSVFILLALGGNIISLGGLAKLTDMCRKEEVNWLSNDRLVVRQDERAYDCGVHYSLQWWIVCFQIYVCLHALLGNVTNVFAQRHFLSHCIAVATTLYCIYASQFVIESYRLKDETDNYSKSVKACAAGAIAVLSSNFLYMLFAPDATTEAASASKV